MEECVTLAGGTLAPIPVKSYVTLFVCVLIMVGDAGFEPATSTV